MGSSHLTFHEEYFQYENHLGTLWILRHWALPESQILHRHLPSRKPLPSLCLGLPKFSPAEAGRRPESESEQASEHPRDLHQTKLQWLPVRSGQRPFSSHCLSCSRVHRLSLHSDIFPIWQEEKQPWQQKCQSL